jgi:hypothetical protein
MGQRYRDRADCENGFDELKSQWGWGRYTTHRPGALQASGARRGADLQLVELVCPPGAPEGTPGGDHQPPPALLSGVARLTQHAGKSRLLLTLSHAAGDQIKAMIASIRKGLDHVRATAPQLPKAARWPALVRYIVDKIIAAKPKMPRPTALASPALAAAIG